MNKIGCLPCSTKDAIFTCETWLPVPENTVLMPGEVIDVQTMALPGIRKNARRLKTIIKQNLPDAALFDPEQDGVQLLKTDNHGVTYFIVNQALWRHWLDLLSGTKKNIRIMPDWMLLPVPRNNDVIFACHLSEGRTLAREATVKGASLPACEVINNEKIHVLKPGRFALNHKRFSEGWAGGNPRSFRYFSAIFTRKWTDNIRSALKMLIIIQVLIFSGMYSLTLIKPHFSSPVLHSQFAKKYSTLLNITDTEPMILRRLNFSDNNLNVQVSSRQRCAVLKNTLVKYHRAVQVEKDGNSQSDCLIRIH